MAFWNSTRKAAEDSASATEPAISTQAQKITAELKQQISQELAAANATELVRTITENCFDKCVETPKGFLDAEENSCIAQCREKYMRSWNVISRAYIARIQEQSQFGR
ncbi:uncharacterized protein LODBEIA_P51150 [Lodderomyces beijingensis]|uniref:Mitochondrial import inner membrane translocase subunit n=1 Tax=Lodderomyces beijingensis TaxID=1775926 RepID=A0ABP0ZV35_9ASCO